jgi:DNA polymerase III alpha subunit
VPYINLHAHTSNSDGYNSMVEMAQRAEALGHCAFVVTDHDYFNSWISNRAMFEIAQQRVSIPIIIGSEIMTPIGECLMFGAANLRQYFEDLKLSSDMYGNTTFCKERSAEFFLDRKKEDCPLILCHPFQMQQCLMAEDRWINAWINRFRKHDYIARLLVGYEGQNQTTVFDKEEMEASFEDFWGIKGLKRFYNSDAHCRDSLAIVCNEIAHPIATEADLIDFLLNGAEPEPCTRLEMS